MDPLVKTCVDARCSMFGTYVDVPEAVEGEYRQFISRIQALGESCSDSAQFEQRFAAEGLQDAFNSLVSKCTPKPVQMTAEQKKASFEMAKEMNKGAGKEMLKDAADMAVTELQQDAISMRRKAMIDSGTFDEYTRTTNKIDDVARLGKFLGGKLRKK